jgi:hypothetical protein
MSTLRVAVRHIFVVSLIALAGNAHCQSEEWSYADIGAPGVSSAWGTGGAITTSTKGLAAVGGADEYAFSYQILRRSDSVEHVVPSLASGSVGRAQGLAIRQSTDPASPAVFWGFKTDGGGTSKLVIQWRRTLGGGVLSSEVNDAPLRSVGGELKLRLQWYGTQAVASYYHHATSTWKPLYAVEVASLEGLVLGGVVHASGAAATPWTDSVPSIESVSKAWHLLPWAKISEPQLAAISPRVTTLGYGFLNTSPQIPEDWSVASHDFSTNGDTFYCALNPGGLTTVELWSVLCRGAEASDVFVRWGAVAGSTASTNVNVEVWDNGAQAFAASVNQQRDTGFWVYVGTLPAQEHALDVYVDGPAASTGHVALDGVLFLSLQDQADTDGDGLADAWEKETNPQLGLNPDDDADGDGLSNKDEYAQSTSPREFNWGIYEYPPAITRIGPADRKAPLGRALILPLQVQALYSGTTTPVSGYEVSYYMDNSLSSLALGLDQPFAPGTLKTRTGVDGVASVYVKLLESEGSIPISLVVEAYSLEYFNLLPYVNHEPGPVDFQPVSSSYRVITEISDSGNIAIMGNWLAVAKAGESGVSAGYVQFYRWEESTNSWRPAHRLVSESTSPLTDGFGADVRMAQNVIAIHASGEQKIHLYELKNSSEYWEKKASFAVSSSMSDYAVAGGALAIGYAADDVVKVIKRTSLGWQTSTPQTFAPSVPQQAQVDYGKRVGFSDDGKTLWMTAPTHSGSSVGQLGDILLCNANTAGTWSVAQTVTGPTLSEGYSFGDAASLVGNSLCVGARSIHRNLGEVGKVYHYEKVGSTWQFVSTLEGGDFMFGQDVWIVGPQVIVAYRSTSGSQDSRWNKVVHGAYATSGTIGAGGELASYCNSITADADSLVMSSTLGSAGVGPILDYRPVAIVSEVAAAGTVVGQFNFNDKDEDLLSKELIQPSDLWELDLTGASQPQLRVSATADLVDQNYLQHWFTVHLKDLAGGDYHQAFPVEIWDQPPAVPTSFTVVPMSKSAARLSWEHDADQIYSFFITYSNLSRNVPPTGLETMLSLPSIPGSRRSYLDVSFIGMNDRLYKIEARGFQSYPSSKASVILRWDADNDGMADWWEAANGGDLSASADDDGDGKTNLQEYTQDSNPSLVDTDGDGTPDGTDAAPLDMLRNSTGLQIFTQLAKP